MHACSFISIKYTHPNRVPLYRFFFFFDGNEIFKKVNIIKTLLPIGYTKLSPLIDRGPFGGP